MNNKLKFVLAASAVTLATQALAQITFYEGESFHGRAFTADKTVRDFSRIGFNDRASSVVVGSGRWEACENSDFGGHCVMLQKGSYDSLRGMGLNDRISSVRPVAARAEVVPVPPPLPEPNYAYHRRPNERVFEVPVTSVHAVMGPPEQRCWVEREQVPVDNAPRAGRGILGAVIGGVIGHQIGGGTGRDLATIGGAVAGAAIGANAGRDRGGVAERDVQRCQTVASNAPPAYWDVTYNYRGVEHRLQMTAPPGATIVVNRDGEPRQ
jgi:uncharacterized protein YcfJ